jgi:hypothetical protein
MLKQDSISLLYLAGKWWMPRSSALKPTISAPLIAAAMAASGRGHRAAVALVLGLLKGYKVLLSPLFTGSCRFYPSCSDYMAEAVTVHGAIRGVWLGVRRLARCHPLGGHGVDQVPDA